jgi:hypothetical protein
MSGDDITKAAVAGRAETYGAGYNHGKEIAATMGATLEAVEITDPYLQYQYLLGVSQAIANHGRDISGIQWGKGNDPQRKGSKA